MPDRLASLDLCRYHFSTMNQPTEPKPAAPPAAPDLQPRVFWWRSIGPGIIIASVVFGPGSLLTSSKIGSVYGYELLWLLVLTALLMGSFLLMAARVGVMGGGTPCQIIAARVGRPVAVLIGLTVCGICSSFQFGNNLAVATAAEQLGVPATVADNWLLPVLNGAVILFLFRARRVYRWMERAAMLMVAMMLIGFAANLVLKVRPDLLQLLAGLTPSWPDGLSWDWPHHKDDSSIKDDMLLIAGFVGTTFVAAGAFLQASLVREKGWTPAEYGKGVSDMIAGVICLTAISGIIMVTAGTVLFGHPAQSVGELATQLRPLFGPVSHALFCLGMLAAALSSVLVNAMMGGMILADGVGLGSRMDDPWTRRFTIFVLLVGMIIAMMVKRAWFEPVNAIIVGQAVTVLGNPLMVGSLWWLAARRDVAGPRRNGVVLNIFAAVGLAVVIVLAIRVVYRLLLQAGVI